jgi:hypothetical protein
LLKGEFANDPNLTLNVGQIIYLGGKKRSMDLIERKANPRHISTFQIKK